MSKIDKLKEKYITDTEAMASKSRFGYFSLLPSHTAAHTDFDHPQHKKDSNGRVVTEPRNVYSGNTYSPSLQKNFFSYTPSAFQGSPYQDPGKFERKKELQQSKQQQGKQKFRPAKLNKTLMSASYSYMSPFDPKTDKKNYRDADGKVITKQPNIQTNPPSKLNYNRSKQFKYVECPPAKKIKSAIGQDEKDPFRTGNSHLEVFENDHRTYFDADLKKMKMKEHILKTASHQGPFKPSCISKADPFTPITYKEEGTGKPPIVKAEKKENKAQPFKLLKVEHIGKPCPSIALSKVNLLRICR